MGSTVHLTLDHFTGDVILSLCCAAVLSKKCGAFWEESPGSDYCYQFNKDMLSWMDAKDMCVFHGGKLASITSVTEQFYIAGNDLRRTPYLETI